ncbi:spermidine synthase-like [Limulus polyphemus]|uniref:Spermidine synthase-like n=1 Tax=Limulus polyphemus TaxID=6850 RepID=A0ABM1T7A0_LIMPO|nr:spermidine synthase-like [Limulus polyphemus]XP_022251755.1 spermidine synthase-like [Limulus polyphemus]XP_022251756.1 spermidine synthase-like [Limulus polyphemus]
MDAFKKGWFSETGIHCSNKVNISLSADNILYHEKSAWQDILVFENKLFGKVLVLDNAIQCTEKDESAYQEMITFLPLNSHPNPKKVLVIGGGDGGVVREVVKHPSVETVVQCEIDEKVIEVSKEYLPFMAEGFKSSKLVQHIMDGAEFMKNHQKEFDVVITDSSDPTGPAASLFRKPYFEGIKQALRPGGILCSQAESFWYDLKLIHNMMNMTRELYPVVEYASVYIPSYPGGQIGFLLCSTDAGTNFRKPQHVLSSEEVSSLKLKYYTSEMHTAAFVLPGFVKKHLYGSY